MARKNPHLGKQPSLFGGTSPIHVPWEELSDQELKDFVVKHGLDAVPDDEWNALVESRPEATEAAVEAREAAVGPLMERLTEDLNARVAWEEEYYRDGDGASDYFGMLYEDLGSHVRDAVVNWRPTSRGQGDIGSLLNEFDADDIRQHQDKVIDILSEDGMYSEEIGSHAGAVVSFGDSDSESEMEIDDEFVERYKKLTLGEIEEAARRTNFNGSSLAEAVKERRDGRRHASVAFGYSLPAYSLSLRDDAAREAIQEMLDEQSDVMDDAVEVALGHAPAGPGPDSDDTFTRMDLARVAALVERLTSEAGDDNGVSNELDWTGDQLAAAFLSALMEVTPAGPRWNKLAALYEPLRSESARSSAATGTWMDPDTGQTYRGRPRSSRDLPVGRDLVVAPVAQGPDLPPPGVARKVAVAGRLRGRKRRTSGENAGERLGGVHYETPVGREALHGALCNMMPGPGVWSGDMSRAIMFAMDDVLEAGEPATWDSVAQHLEPDVLTSVERSISHQDIKNRVQAQLDVETGKPVKPQRAVRVKRAKSVEAEPVESARRVTVRKNPAWLKPEDVQKWKDAKKKFNRLFGAKPGPGDRGALVAIFKALGGRTR